MKIQFIIVQFFETVVPVASVAVAASTPATAESSSTPPAPLHFVRKVKVDPFAGAKPRDELAAQYVYHKHGYCCIITTSIFCLKKVVSCLRRISVICFFYCCSPAPTVPKH